MTNKTNEWMAHKVMQDEGMGYALFAWNKEGLMWQQVSNWYTKKGNLRRYVLKHYGLYIM